MNLDIASTKSELITKGFNHLAERDLRDFRRTGVGGGVGSGDVVVLVLVAV